MGRLVLVEILDAQGAVRHRVRLDRWPATVGRSYRAEVLLDDPYVSPEHVRLIDGDGEGVVAEDLESLNGIYTPHGDRVRRVVLGPGATMRVGRTMLRFLYSEQAVTPTLLDSAAPAGVPGRPSGETPHAGGLATPARGGGGGGSVGGGGGGGGWLGDPRVQIAACGAAFVVSAANVYLDNYRRTAGPTAVTAGLGVFLILGLWAGGWAFAGRVIRHRAEFLSHLAIASAVTVGLVAVSEVASWLSFLYPGGWSASAVETLGGIGLGVGLLSGHLALASRMPPARRWRVAGTVTAVAIAFGLFVSYADGKKFTTKMTYPSALQPLAAGWVPATSMADFIGSTRKLETQVDSLALER
jgi:hypothetical protein